MVTGKYELYLVAKKAREAAEEWKNMPETKGRLNSDSFGMSPAQGAITLMRCGQYTAGGTNYWKSPKHLNAAMLSVIASDPSIVLRAIDVLKKAETAALIDCDQEMTLIMDAISAAKNKENEGV